MKRLILAGALLALLGGSTLQAQPRAGEDSVLPGYWQYKTRFLGVTVDNEKKCVKPEEVDQFFSGPCNRHHTCRYPVRVVGGGKARFEGYWQNKEGARTNVKASGVYSPKAFTLKANAKGLAATLEATWLGPTCPAGLK